MPRPSRQKSDLIRLPENLLAKLLAWIPFSGLARLYGTLNKKLQKKLISPGLIESIELDNACMGQYETCYLLYDLPGLSEVRSNPDMQDVWLNGLVRSLLNHYELRSSCLRGSMLRYVYNCDGEYFWRTSDRREYYLLWSELPRKEGKIGAYFPHLRLMYPQLRKSTIDKQKIIKFMKQYEGNEVEETLKAVANWLVNGIFQSPELLIAKAKEYLKAKQTEVALELLKDAIEASPNRLNSYEELMQFYRTQKSFDKAIKVGKMALTVDNQALNILDLMGRIYGDAGKMQEAIDTYQKVIDINPQAAPTIYRQAWYQVAVGKFKDAQANVISLDKLEYEAGAATIRYLISRASKDPPALVEKLGKRAMRLNPDNSFLTSLVSITYDPKEDTKSIFG